ncbi:hypothetical protein HMI55_004642 [Coelomomyces lativittatus]|nr:hypothetical protein HMI55_004642 [Coelomomyces lativittatus]
MLLRRLFFVSPFLYFSFSPFLLFSFSSSLFFFIFLLLLFHGNSPPTPIIKPLFKTSRYLVNKVSISKLYYILTTTLCENSVFLPTKQKMSSQNLWVQHTTARKSLIDLVPIEGCTYIAQLKVTIRNNPELDIPPASKITLYQPDGKTEIDIGDSPTDYLDGNSRRNPLIVKTTAIAKKKKKR